MYSSASGTLTTSTSSSVQRDSSSIVITHSIAFDGTTTRYGPFGGGWSCGSLSSSSSYDAVNQIQTITVTLSGGTAGQYCSYSPPSLLVYKISATKATITNSASGVTNFLGSNGGTVNL